MENTEKTMLPALKTGKAHIVPDCRFSMTFSGLAELIAVKSALKADGRLFVIGSEQETGDVGVVCHVEETVVETDRSNDRQRITLRFTGLFRAEMVTDVSGPFPKCEISAREYAPFDADVIAEYTEILRQTVGDLTEELLKSKKDILKFLQADKPVSVRLNNIVELLPEDFDRASYLKTDDLAQAIQDICVFLKMTEFRGKIREGIEARVSENVRKGQKDFMLREQMRAIRQELGEDGKETRELEEKIRALKIGEDAREKLLRDLERMTRMPASSPEASVLRNYFDVVLALPWGAFSTDKDDLNEIRAVLDAEHYGLEDVKQRIVEYMAVRKLAPEKSAPVICLVGAPGVGKTSIAQSVARAIGKEYVHMSLGGIHDEAEIRGHRRTYVAAMPGRIISCLAKAKTANPLFLLDEIDKLCSDMHGDPSGALLEVLDPKQNCAFRDNFLEIPFDLSQVFFIMTANTLAGVQKPLLDRMEVIEVSGYTLPEKTEIALRYLVPKQIEAHGLGDVDLRFTPEAIAFIAENYTKEAGVRELERCIAKICRKIATEVVDGAFTGGEIGASQAEGYLGVPKYVAGEDAVRGEVGAVNGLAWTNAGGVLMPVEVRLLPAGKGDLILTGSLGDVLKESAMIALSLARSAAPRLGIAEERFTAYNLHVHLPEGATPKDGPSAGIALTTAILSAAADRPVAELLAMTGEVTLRGKVLAIGGLKEKLLAAQRNGIKKVIVPRQNEKNAAELPESLLAGLDIVYASEIGEVFDCALGCGGA